MAIARIGQDQISKDYFGENIFPRFFFSVYIALVFLYVNQSCSLF